jgi:cytochrome c oxidase subunit 2
MQSALAPAGPAAQEIASLTGVLAVGAALVLALVIALVAGGAWRAPAPASTAAWVLGGGIAFPVMVLSALLVYSSDLTGALGPPAPAGARPIEIVGHQWWWEVRYPQPAGGPDAIAANEVYVPVGQTVEMRLTTSDVIHSFWVPSLAGKIDMVPGRRNRLVIRADREGVYRGQCAEFCGVQHAQMALDVIAVPPAAFETWLRRQAAPARDPGTPELAQGHDAFMALGCGGCHAIRGTIAQGPLGPDLTHVASRRMLGAGATANGVRELEHWIADPGAIKPGNRMPSSALLDPPTRRAIAVYLASLE